MTSTFDGGGLNCSATPGLALQLAIENFQMLVPIEAVFAWLADYVDFHALSIISPRHWTVNRMLTSASSPSSQTSTVLSRVSTKLSRIVSCTYPRSWTNHVSWLQYCSSLLQTSSKNTTTDIPVAVGIENHLSVHQPPTAHQVWTSLYVLYSESLRPCQCHCHGHCHPG